MQCRKAKRHDTLQGDMPWHDATHALNFNRSHPPPPTRPSGNAHPHRHRPRAKHTVKLTQRNRCNDLHELLDTGDKSNYTNNISQRFTCKLAMSHKDLHKNTSEIFHPVHDPPT